MLGQTLKGIIWILEMVKNPQKDNEIVLTLQLELGIEITLEYSHGATQLLL